MNACTNIAANETCRQW